MRHGQVPGPQTMWCIVPRTSMLLSSDPERMTFQHHAGLGCTLAKPVFLLQTGLPVEDQVVCCRLV